MAFYTKLDVGLHRHKGHWRYSTLVDCGTVWDFSIISLFNSSKRVMADTQAIDNVFRRYNKVSFDMGGLP